MTVALLLPTEKAGPPAPLVFEIVLPEGAFSWPATVLSWTAEVVVVLSRSARRRSTVAWVSTRAGPFWARIVLVPAPAGADRGDAEVECRGRARDPSR